MEDVGFDYDVDYLDNGDFPFKYIIKFDNEISFWCARSWYSKNKKPHIFIPNFITQYLIQSQTKLYDDINFNNLKRMQFDIETNVDKIRAFPNASIDKINTISIRQDNFVKILVGNEKDILNKFFEYIQELNPDVLEGHNIINFDIPYILKRCQVNNIYMDIARESIPFYTYQDSLRTGELTTKFTKYNFFGRIIVDTLHLVKHDDNIKRNYPSCGLKDAAKHLGIAEPNRVILKGNEIFEEFKKRSKKYRDYCLEDVNEVKRISDLLLPSFFYQCKLLPYDLQSIITSGAAGKINNMIVRHYMKKNHSIPKAGKQKKYDGGLVECYKTGLIKKVHHIDVSSLYPSIILQYKLFPKNDVLNYFKTIYPKIKDYRIKNKNAGNKAISESFKIIINSFYGYMGYAHANFNDFDNAEFITSKGREILKTIGEIVKNNGYDVVEIDTDGLYINENYGCLEMSKLVQVVNELLPTQINIEHDGYYENMISLKKKNYILDDGKQLVYKGATKGRGLEPFLKDFTHSVFQGIIDNIPIEDIYEKYIDIVSNSEDVSMFIKKGNIHKTLKEYAQGLEKNSNKSCIYELWKKYPKRYGLGQSFNYYIYGDDWRVKAFESCQFDYEYDDVKYPINREYYKKKLTKKFKQLRKEIESW